MRTNILVATTILLASFAAAMPTASAFHDCLGGVQEACVEAYSSSWGDGECETAESGGASNTLVVGASSLPVTGTSDATVSTYCYREGEYYAHTASVRVSAGLVTARVVWGDSHNAFATYCQSRVIVSNVGTNDLPVCSAAGGPPSVPALLP